MDIMTDSPNIMAFIKYTLSLLSLMKGNKKGVFEHLKDMIPTLLIWNIVVCIVL